MSAWHLRRARQVIWGGGVIAYPTEAVFGLGCDPLNPRAVRRLLGLKGRSADKGLILIAARREQLAGLVAPLFPDAESRLAKTWPGFNTWLLPAAPGAPDWLTGGRDTLAVRVTAHPLASALCLTCGTALVSTSANRSGRAPARDVRSVRRVFGTELDMLVPGTVTGGGGVSPIRDVLSGAVLRPQT